MEAGARARRLEAVLDCFQSSDAEPLALFTALFDLIRPERIDDSEAASAHYRVLLELLQNSPERCAATRKTFQRLLDTTQSRTFFSDSGLLPETGFFSELWRKLANRILPDTPDPGFLRDAVSLIFHNRNDYRWLSEVPAEYAIEFWRLVGNKGTSDATVVHKSLHDIIEAAQVVSYRLAALGLDPELAHAWPAIDAGESAFIAQNIELRHFIKSYRATLEDPSLPHVDEKHLLVLIDQCREMLKKVQNAALTRGTSLRLSYIVVRLWQHLARLETLVQLLTSHFNEDPSAAALGSWATFARAAICGENSRHSIRQHFSQLMGMLAMRITKNAGRTGEHYITTDREGYFGMWRSAMGAGLLIGIMALLKILTAKLHLPPLLEGIAFSLNYAFGFMLIHVLHFTVATKQPAMTASAIADTIGQIGGKLRELERLGQLIVDVMRSQFAAICGNVLIAFPAALCIGLALSQVNLNPVTEVKAQHLLHELSPLRSLALLHAAIAGVWLFVSGLISGYFDNKAAYDSIAPRIANLRWLQAVAGRDGATRLGEYMQENLGGLAGNFFFGFMLGMTGTISMLFGLPLDIRHIAFASANLAYGLIGLDFAVGIVTWIYCIVGVALIGMVNLGVSFTLALFVAMKAHDVRFRHAGALLKMMWQRFTTQPMQFFLPPPKATNLEHP